MICCLVVLSDDMFLLVTAEFSKIVLIKWLNIGREIDLVLCCHLCLCHFVECL